MYSGDKAGGRRNLPSWMSSRDTGDSGGSDKLRRNMPNHDDGAKPEQGTSQAKLRNGGAATHGSFSKLLEGVVFVLSGFVNPGRSTLRSQAKEMGAEYHPDWNSNCTLLICAFPNTPKFRQVEADCGTIVSKDWISECYSQKNLVPIETYLMHAGKPWRKSGVSHETCQDNETTPPEKSHKQVEKSLPAKPMASFKGGAPTLIGECLSPTKVKKWAINDLDETVSWLESQEERPEPAEMKKIAAEGILTCLQDAIESLEKNQGIRQATEQWNFIPRVVKELARLEDMKSSKRSVTGKDICEQALACKRIYEMEFESVYDDSTVENKRPKASKADQDVRKTDTKSTDAAYDSDETIEMTEDEIGLAYESISSKLCK